MRRVLEKEGRFSIERLEMTNPYSQYRKEHSIESMIKQVRASMEGILSANFGDSVVDKLFSEMLAKSEEILPLMEAGFEHSTQLLLVLKRM